LLAEVIRLLPDSEKLEEFAPLSDTEPLNVPLLTVTDTAPTVVPEGAVEDTVLLDSDMPVIVSGTPLGEAQATHPVIGEVVVGPVHEREPDVIVPVGVRLYQLLLTSSCQTVDPIR